jgi:hypothetical protein
MADYLEGDLSLAKRALFDAHLDSCELCANELHEMRRTINLLRALPTPEPPPDLVDNVMRRIRLGEGQSSWLDRVGGWLSELASPRIAIPAAALAASVAVALVTSDLRLDLPGFGEPQRSRQVAALNPSETPEKIARRASGDAGPGDLVPAPAVGGQSELGSATRVASARQPGNDRPGAAQAESSTRYYVQAQSRPTPPPVLQPRPGIREQPPGFLSASAKGPGELTQKVSASLPKGQRRLIELDGRLNSLLESPDGFARWMNSLTLTEQELWLDELAERARQRDLVEEVTLALGESDAAAGRSLAAAFASAAERSDSSTVVPAESKPTSE